MRTRPPGLADDQLVDLLRRSHGFTATTLEYLPVGFGSHHWLATDGATARRFVTVDVLDDAGPSAAETVYDRLRRAMTSAYALHEDGLDDLVLAPRPGLDGQVVQALAGRYAVTVFDHLVAEHLAAETPADRAAIIAALARLHRHTSIVRGIAGRDNLAVQDRPWLDRALTGTGPPRHGGPFSEPAGRMVAAHAAELRELVTRYDRMAAALLRRGTDGWVITHGEPKPDNLLATERGLALIDWDTALIAPPARDLWMVATDGAHDGEVGRTYRDLAGRHVPVGDLRTFRLRWDLGEVASYVRWFTLPHEDDDDCRVAWTALQHTLELLHRWRRSPV